MRITFLAVTCLALASDLGAQEEASPLIFGTRISKDRLVSAVRSCDQKVLRPPCTEVVKKAEQIFPSFGKGNLQFADYLASLEPRECPPGARVGTTEWVPSSKLLFIADHPMTCEPREVHLWDKKANRPVISLYDGHLIWKYAPATQQVATAPAETLQAGAPQIPVAVVDTPTTPRRAVPDQRIPVVKPGKPVIPRTVTVARVDTVTRLLRVTDTVKVTTNTVTEVRKGPRVWPWVVGTILAGGGIYACVRWCGGDEDELTSTTTVIVNNSMAIRRGGFSFSIGR
jgi:hypothetical protein